jgi:ribosomal protein S18 acetylase RimI-like enzyme
MSGSGCIRAARPSDAMGIYALKLNVFGDRYLPYTIYQAPQSVHYLAELIACGPDLSCHRLFVISQNDEITGYYHAVRRDTEFFLNYIAVAVVARGQGWGNALLKHYEDTGRALGCQHLALDVFDSNRRVRDWYQNHGYQVLSAFLSASFALNAWTIGSSFPLEYDYIAWTQARKEEQARGFSKIECLCGPGRLSVGLIAGRVCKLLSYEGIKVENAVLAIVRRFRAERRVLIVPSLFYVPPDWPVLNVEKVLRLMKLA